MNRKKFPGLKSKFLGSLFTDLNQLVSLVAWTNVNI